MSDDTSTPTIPIYTIGYGARSIDEFLAALHRYDIAYLLDLRSAPYSRYKPEFSKDALAARLRAEGVHYLFVGDALGGQPADRACYVDDKVVYDRVCEKAFYREGIERVRRAFAQQLRIALMCSEGKPSTCHRAKLIGVTLEEMGVPVAHIDESGELRSQAEVISALTEGQLNLFGEPEFRSRKRYHGKRDGRDTPFAEEDFDDD
jgi:uncharacterized protein (DUF488 family)